jgi:hypothetical protein
MADKTKHSTLRGTWEEEVHIIILCPATRFGEDAWIKINGRNQSGVVHSVFDHAMNILLSGNYFLTVLSDKYLSVPFGISLDLEEGFSFRNWTEPGEIVWVNKNRIWLKSKIFDLTSGFQPHIINCSIKPCDINKFNPEVTELIHSWVTESFYRGGFYELYDSLFFSVFDEVCSSNDPVSIYAHRLLKTLKKNFLDENGREAAETLNEFVGLGTGLTPSGDDFILGFLAFFHFLKKPLFRSNIIGDIRKKLMNSISGRTTMISEVYLNYGLNGQFSEILTEFIQSLFITDAAELRKKTFKLLSVGSTSGMDMIAGCLFAIHLSLYKMNLTKRHLKYA